MPDHDQIDPTRDRVWAVDVTVRFTSYVVAETVEEAERIAAHADIDLDPHFSARELNEPLEEADPEGREVPFGASCWEGREITVNEAVELLMPAHDDETLLMPFVDAPPPLHPREIEDYLADGRSAR